jgi:hypothetical protein
MLFFHILIIFTQLISLIIFKKVLVRDKLWLKLLFILFVRLRFTIVIIIIKLISPFGWVFRFINI